MRDKELNPQALSIINDIRKAENSGERVPIYKMTPREAREAYLGMRANLSPPPPDVFDIRELRIKTDESEILARYYRGKKNKNKDILPVTIFFHGGGWVIGDLDTHDVVCRQLSNRGDFDVISVDYRMGPENPFPAAVNDAISSVNWIATNSKSLPIDTKKIAVCGDSAGGNLAAVSTIAAKINSGPKISYQCLIYPAIHMGGKYTSKDKYDGYILSNKLMDWFQQKYIKDKSINYDDWRLSPICSSDLKNLPPGIILIAGCDPLRDEGLAYAKKLKKLGNEIETIIFKGQIHGFLTMGARINDSQKLIEIIAKKINDKFK